MRTFTLALSLAALSASSAFGANCLATSSTCPVVKLVRAAANEPLRSHPAYPGRAAILKATVVPTAATISYDWDFGDGTPHATGTVTDIYAIEASHNYALPGAFTAILTLTNGTTSETFSANYSISVSSKVLANEVAIAIEDGLWYLHKTLQRSVVSSVPYGTWMSCGFPTCAPYGGIDAQNIQAFETGGFLENGDPNDPYTETVSRSMKAVLEKLTSTAISNTKTIYVNGTLGSVTLNPDVNGNGAAVYPSGGNEMYQGGMFMDALVASKTPSKLVDFGPLADGLRTYGDVVQDQVDYHVNCQDVGDPGGFFGARNGGGWRYSCNSDADNSVNQWAAIGLIAAEDEWGKTAPAAAKQANAEGWLLQSRDTGSGVFGYDSPSPIWGPFATTPSGMVQLVWSHIGRGDSRWAMAESYLRDNFGNGGGSSNNLKAYYYGLFSFTKSMLLHNPGTGIAPISLLQSTTPGVNPIDWYGAERDMSLPESVNNTNGVARTLVNEQSAQGYWKVTPEPTTEQDAFHTSWAVIMLRRTVFQLLPVSCFTATPALVANGGPVQFDAKCSFHQDTSKQIVKYEWDFSGNNQAYVLGTPQMRRNMSGAVGSNIAVRLRITDNSVPALSA
ncbi:MAG: PKD domain-containing protein, partial [Acidobacteria bacterium]|nr:PKD domain-containing protein [Acidobacteriota bacterium]